MEINTVTTQHENKQLTEIRKIKTDFSSLEDYLAYRDGLMNQAINPWLKEAYQHSCTRQEIPSGMWVLVACETVDGATTTTALLDYVELDFDELHETDVNFDGLMSLNDWVELFNPKSWGDWLMVPRLFTRYILRQHVPALVFTADPWIDAMLHESRGTLMWTSQFIEIIRIVAGVGRREALDIYSSISLRKSGWQERLNKIHYLPTNQTLLQIFEERTVGLRSFGSPDYLLSNWLSNYYGKIMVSRL